MKTRPFGPLCVALLASCFLSPVLHPAVQAQTTPVAEESKYPKPDLKEVEKHFKVVKYLYDDAKEQVVMTVIPLSDSVPATYKLLFYDAGGERIDSGYTLFYYSTVVGEPKTCKIQVPKRVLDRATKATLSR